VMMGVEMFLAALMISLMRGTPRVMFMAATPAKWKVFSVICVPGSPMDCAPKAPTVDPAVGSRCSSDRATDDDPLRVRSDQLLPRSRPFAALLTCNDGVSWMTCT
jgi:hypothetical protein